MEYNAENASGFIKSWDNAYMQNMLHVNGTYPNEYTRYYANQLLEGQGEGAISAISGASSSHGTFQLLAAAVLEQARIWPEAPCTWQGRTPPPASSSTTPPPAPCAAA